MYGSCFTFLGQFKFQQMFTEPGRNMKRLWGHSEYQSYAAYTSTNIIRANEEGCDGGAFDMHVV